MQFSHGQTVVTNLLPNQNIYSRHRDCLFHSVSPKAWKALPAGDQRCAMFSSDCISSDGRGHELPLPSRSRYNGVLSYGDIVIIEHEGKPKRGFVLEHKLKLDQVIVKLEGTGDFLARRPSEIRLVADALRPCPTPGSKPYFPWENINEVLQCQAQDQSMDRKQSGEQSEIRQAAMALTALSLSPVAPDLGRETGNTEESRFLFPPADEFMTAQQRYSDTKPRSFSLDSAPFLYKQRRRPPLYQQHSVPVTSSYYGRTSPGSLSGPGSPKSFDEGFASSDGSDYSETPPFKKKKSQDEKKRKMFQCMWRGCTNISSSLRGIISHVRLAHLGPENGDKYQDGEEEFYFNDIEYTDSDTESVSGGALLSLDNLSITSSDTDNLKGQQPANATSFELPRKNEAISVELNESSISTSTTADLWKPLKSAPSDKTASNDKLRKVQKGRGKLNSGRFRSDKGKRRSNNSSEDLRLSKAALNESVKKCRKMYGMESKHLWCTQCRWKKACVRFR